MSRPDLGPEDEASSHLFAHNAKRWGTPAAGDGRGKDVSPTGRPASTCPGSAFIRHVDYFRVARDTGTIAKATGQATRPKYCNDQVVSGRAEGASAHAEWPSFGIHWALRHN